MRSWNHWCCLTRPFTVRTSHLSATHVRTYMAVVGGEPSGAQPLPSNGIYPLATPTLVGEPHNTCKQTLGILQIMNCTSSWSISAERLHSESWMHLPGTPTNTLGKSCRKLGSWYRWPGGNLSESGRVGSPGATILTSCPCTNRWGLGAWRTTYSPPSTCSTWCGHRVPENTLATGLCLGNTQINTFSSNAMPGKMEVSFEQ